MAERDPFGRLPDENPLAGLGGLSDGSSSQSTAEPVLAGTASFGDGASAAPRPNPNPRPPSPRPQAQAQAAARARASAGAGVDPAMVLGAGRVVGRLVRSVVLLIVLGVLFGVGGTVLDAIKSVKDTVSSTPSPSRIGKEAPPPPPEESSSDKPAAKQAPAVPVGLSSNSMLRQRNLGPALEHLSKAGLGQVRTMSIRPERMDGQLLTKSGSLRSVQVTTAGKVNELGGATSGFSQLDALRYAQIDPSAPARLARSAAGRSRKPVSQIDYVVILSFDGKPMWSAYMKGGKAFLADAHGRITRRIS